MIDAHRVYQSLFNRALDMNEVISRDLQRDLRLEIADQKHAKAAETYILLFSLSTKKIDYVLRAGQAFEKAKDKKKAATCYYLAAKSYAEEGFGIQAIAALQMHQRIAPEEKKRIQPILEQCHEQGFVADNMDPLMTTGVRVSYHLRAQNVFGRLSQESFEQVLQSIEHRYLEVGEILTKSTVKSRCIYIVVNGNIEEWASVQGKAKRFATITQGGICAALGYFTGEQRNMLLKASTKSEVMILPYQEIDRMQKENKELREHWQLLYQEHVLVQQLAMHPMMQKVKPPQRIMMSKHMEAVDVPKGEAVYQEGDSSDDIYFVRNGRLAVSVNINGAPKMLRQLRTGAFIGEQALVNQGKRTETVFAMEPSLLLKIKGETFEKLCGDTPSVQEWIQKKQYENKAMIVKLTS